MASGKKTAPQRLLPYGSLREADSDAGRAVCALPACLIAGEIQVLHVSAYSHNLAAPVKKNPRLRPAPQRPIILAAYLTVLLSACNSSGTSSTEPVYTNRPTDNNGIGTAAMVAATPPVNDTGTTYCGDATGGNNTTCNGTEPALQDALIGRDAAAAASALAKTGVGTGGFDFTKLGADGSALTIQDQAWSVDSSGYDNGAETAGTFWRCVKDNVTGLTWEVKTHYSTADLQDRSWTYSWFNNANISGHKGTEASGSCFQSGRCDTEKYVQDVNALGLCGHSDWRLPNQQELAGLALLGTTTPTIDTTRFPNTLSLRYWSGSAYAGQQNLARYVSFTDGHATYGYRSNGYAVRLVHD